MTSSIISGDARLCFRKADCVAKIGLVSKKDVISAKAQMEILGKMIQWLFQNPVGISTVVLGDFFQYLDSLLYRQRVIKEKILYEEKKL